MASGIKIQEELDKTQKTLSSQSEFDTNYQITSFYFSWTRNPQEA